MKNTSARSAFAVGAHTPEQVLAFHRATFGDARMEAEQGSDSPAAEKPEGVSDAEWDALGDPGKQALVRERQARADLEAQLAEARKPKPSPPAQKTGEEKGEAAKDASKGDDLEARIAAAVQAALAPVQESQQQWQAEQLAARAGDLLDLDAETVATLQEQPYRVRGDELRANPLRIGDAEILVAQYSGLLPGRSFTELRLRGLELTLERATGEAAPVVEGDEDDECGHGGHGAQHGRHHRHGDR